MTQKWTQADVDRLQKGRGKAQKAVGTTNGARTKYGAVPTTVDGIRFHSSKEAKRYRELKLLQKAGHIRNLVLQPDFTCFIAGIALGKYISDFSYFDVRLEKGIVEDCKGFRTPLYRWKKKHVEAQYGIEIREL